MFKSSTIIITLLSISLVKGDGVTEQKFSKKNFRQYRGKFGKLYVSSNEARYRAEIYDANMVEAEAFNKEQHSWTKGENMFTDLTPEERQNYLGYFPGSDLIEVEDGSTPSNNDDVIDTTSGSETDSNSGQASQSTHVPEMTGLVGSTINPFAALPQKINWLAAGLMSGVKNQGACGACWAFTTTALVESLYKKKYNTEINLSEQELVDCSITSTYMNYGCNGGFNPNGLNYYRLFGSHLESQYPYIGRQSTCKKLYTNSYKVASVTTVKKGSLVALLTALSKGPVATAYFVANDFYGYRSGIYDYRRGCKLATNINHAVLAVGYDLNPAAPYIMFKNSWGKYFGEGGYFRMSMNLVDLGNGPCNLTKFATSATASL